MARYILAPAAQADLEGISDYTVTRRGETPCDVELTPLITDHLLVDIPLADILPFLPSLGIHFLTRMYAAMHHG